MVHHGQLRLSRSTLTFWKWALGISVGATSAVLVITGGSVPTIVTTPDLSHRLEATGTASASGTTLTTASLVLPAAVETPPAPATVLPLVRPPEKPQSAADKPVKARAPATKVAHFDSCLPSCETRDPQVAIAGPTAPLPPRMVILEPAAPVPPMAVPEPSVSFLPPSLLDSLQEPIPMPPPRQSPVALAVDTGQALIDQAVGASDAVVDGTKRAFGAAVDLVW